MSGARNATRSSLALAGAVKLTVRRRGVHFTWSSRGVCRVLAGDDHADVIPRRVLREVDQRRDYRRSRRAGLGLKVATRTPWV